VSVLTKCDEGSTVKLPADVSLKDIVTAMLGTPPPPAGDASTRKQTSVRKKTQAKRKRTTKKPR
jgi:hypothetical protein